MLPSSYAEKSEMTAANEPPMGGGDLADVLGSALVFPTGLLGFAHCRRFALSRFEPGGGLESPFLVLQSLDQELSFLLVPPELVVSDYQVPSFPELLKTLGAESAAELLTLLIVTVRDRVEDISVNLQGPLVLSSRSHVGIQLVLEEFPLRHPLVVPPDR